MDSENHLMFAFDFDGTLFHLPVDFARLRADLGLEANAGLGDAFQRYLDEGNSDALDIVTRHEREAVQRGEFTTGACELLQELPSRLPVAIVTRNSRYAVTDALGNLEKNVFIVGREDVARLKPDPEALHSALAHYGAEAEKAVLVGDTFHDVEAAHAVGMHSIVVRNDLLKYRPDGADRYVETLRELLNADDAVDVVSGGI